MHDFSWLSPHSIFNTVLVLVLLRLYFLLSRKLEELGRAILSIPGFMDAKTLKEEVQDLKLEKEANRAAVLERVDKLRQESIAREQEFQGYRRQMMETQQAQLREERKLRISMERTGRQVAWVMEVIQRKPCVVDGSCDIPAAPLPPLPNDSDLKEPDEPRDDMPWLPDPSEEEK